MFEIRNDVGHHFGQAARHKESLIGAGERVGLTPKKLCTLSFLLSKKAKRPSFTRRSLYYLPGNDLLSQDPAVQVSSALEVLTSVFEMGTGGTPPE